MDLAAASQRLRPILKDLGATPDQGGAGRWHHQAVLVVSPEELAEPPSEADTPLDDLAQDGLLLVAAEGSVSESEFARWRNLAWPRFHAVALYRLGPWGIHRESLAGRAKLQETPEPALCVLAARRREHVLSPDATREKFDQNASGWNGEPGGPGYPHFRWMRRFVAEFADLPGLRQRAQGPLTVLDFGSGAGWVGIEAALRLPDARLDLFDPSPEMVKNAEQNARQVGLKQCRGRVGFGEAPPFPGAGEPPYDLVLSSGVVSFSPDFERFMQGLARAVKPGGTLVIGDIFPGSRGMTARRRERALLPVRELNGVTPEPVRAWLEARGFRHQATTGYQLTFPWPQLMHFNETRGRGLLSHPLVWGNALAAGLDRLTGHRLAKQFDSWVMRFVAPGTGRP
jgi:SAM-dependent methyltransferase